MDTDVHVSARTMASAAGISLWQAQLQRILWDKVTILMSPVGARFKDIAQSLHTSKGMLILLNDENLSSLLPALLHAPQHIVHQ